MTALKIIFDLSVFIVWILWEKLIVVTEKDNKHSPWISLILLSLFMIIAGVSVWIIK
jgi:hypothetical protein